MQRGPESRLPESHFRPKASVHRYRSPHQCWQAIADSHTPASGRNDRRADYRRADYRMLMNVIVFWRFFEKKFSYKTEYILPIQEKGSLLLLSAIIQALLIFFKVDVCSSLLFNSIHVVRPYLPRYTRVRRFPIWSPSTYPRTPPTQDANRASPHPHAHTPSLPPLPPHPAPATPPNWIKNKKIVIKIIKKLI